MATSYSEGLEAFLAEAKQTYERMFGAGQQDELKTFTQREVRVYDEGRRLSRFLLERHLAQDKNNQLNGAETALCPQCQRPSQKVGDPEVRPATTLIGDITFPRAKYKCKPCRRLFFSYGPETGTA